MADAAPADDEPINQETEEKTGLNFGSLSWIN